MNYIKYRPWDLKGKPLGLHTLSSYEEKLLCTTVAGRIMPPPKDIYFLISRTCGYFTLHDKADFVDLSKTKDLERGDYSELFECAQSLTIDRFFQLQTEKETPREGSRKSQFAITDFADDRREA